MRLFSLAAALSCAALLAGCNRQAATESDAERQQKEQLAEEQQAQILSAMHEREAALDERERLLDEREQIAPASASPAAQQPVAPTPPPVAAPPPSAAPEVTYQEFYDALSPYGSWVQMAGYDYVWQPLATVQDSRWRPYTVGQWAYTDDGWTWLSDEPFGWLTYHYGRWMRTHTLGWVWVPGDQWAPAWVSWRYGNNYVGWAPLPPEARFDGATGIQQWADEQYDLGASDYTFVPAADFGEPDMADVDVPSDENEPIYDDSNNETNIYYDSGSYSIICYGPDYDFMRSKSRRPLSPPLTLARFGYRSGGENGTVVSGHTLNVTAPRIVAPRRAVAPRAVRGSVADTRLVNPAAPQPLLGAASQPQFTQPQAAIPTQAAPASGPAQTNVAPIPQGRSQFGESNPGVPAPADNRPAGANVPPAPNPANAQNDRDRALSQQQQLEREQQADRERQTEDARNAEQARQAEEARQAEAVRQAEEARAERQAADEHAAREDQAEREEAATRATQSQPVSAPAGVPAGSPGGFPTR
jgi:hypothetical protein